MKSSKGQSNSFRHFILPLLFLLAVLVVPARAQVSETSLSLQASGAKQWYRGNLHTHSHWSDGDDYLDTIAHWYRENDYQFLVFTDHNVLADSERWVEVKKSKGGLAAFEKLKATFPGSVESRTNDDGELSVRLRTFAEVSRDMNIDGKFLLVQGEEVSAAFEQKPIHLCVANLPELLPALSGRSVQETIQDNVRAVEAQSRRTGQPIMIHLNHPNFGYAVTAEDLMSVRGENFFEVYNGHPAVRNAGDEQHAGTERIWDIILTRRLAELNMPIMYGLAVDDGHDYHHHGSDKSNPGRGWVMVLAEDLSAASLIASLEIGQFYSSSGVTLRRVTATPKEISIEINPVEGETFTVDFIGTRRGYDPSSEPVRDEAGKEIRATRRYSADMGTVLQSSQGTQVTYKFTGDEIYVRARITSSAAPENPSEPNERKRAWCQPVRGPSI